MTFGFFVVAATLLFLTCVLENSPHVYGYVLVPSGQHRANMGGFKACQNKRKPRTTSLNMMLPWMVNDILLATATTTATESTAAATSSLLDPSTITTGLVSALVLVMAPIFVERRNSNNQDAGGMGENERDPSGGNSGMDRRGTLLTLASGAASLAASDMLLGTAGKLLGGAAGGVSSSVYEARWFSLFRRVAQHRKEYEAAAASPELLAWISRTPAAFANPELRAWVAANRAFNKSRQVAMAAAALEEGMASAGLVAAAAAARTKKTTSPDVATTGNEEDGDVKVNVKDAASKKEPMTQVILADHINETERLEVLPDEQES